MNKAENPLKIEDTVKYRSNIKVYNKGKIPIYRDGFTFLPGKTSKELSVTLRTYKELKSCVNLRVESIA